MMPKGGAATKEPLTQSASANDACPPPFLHIVKRIPKTQKAASIETADVLVAGAGFEPATFRL